MCIRDRRIALLASPVLAILLVIRAVVRQIRRSDEFIRKTTAEHLAIAATATAGITFTYGFLELAGFPRLSMFFVWPLMAAAWLATSAIDYLRHRRRTRSATCAPNAAGARPRWPNS